MRLISITSIILLGLLLMEGCRQDRVEVMPMNFSMDINGVRYQQDVLAQRPNKKLLGAGSDNDRFSCGFESVYLTFTKPVFEGGLLALYINPSSLIKRYSLTGESSPNSPCSKTDSIQAYVNVEEQPVTASHIDLMSIAVYELDRMADNYLEVTHFDAEKRQMRGRFQLKVIRSGVHKHIPIPISDTLEFTNGEFSVGFSRTN